jgi:hypothetical protein
LYQIELKLLVITLKIKIHGEMLQNEYNNECESKKMYEYIEKNMIFEKLIENEHNNIKHIIIHQQDQHQILD